MINNKKYLYLLIAFVSMGFSSMMSQIIILRELVILFTGNELTYGIILGLWLFGTAFGSGVLGRLSAYINRPIAMFVFLQVLFALVLPSTIIFIRLSRSIFSITSGEIISPFHILLIPFIALMPICFIVGFLYTLGCKLLSQNHPGKAEIPGRVYFYEAIGSGVAGFIASMILFRIFNNFQVVTIVCSIVVLTIICIFIFYLQRWKIWIISLSCLVMIPFIIFSAKINRNVNQESWDKLNLLETRTTIYGNIAVTQVGESINFYENGMLMFTHPDQMYAEESVHFAMLEHPSPQRVLLIGGNVVGSVSQILAHSSVKHVDFVLLDPATIKLSQKYLNDTENVLSDPRVNVWFQDGRLFLKKSKDQYDVIIINLPAPQTTMINRFYTLEFYEIVKRNLKPTGIISFSIPATETVLSDEQAEFLSCLYRTVDHEFEDIILIPGYSVHFVACNAINLLTTDAQILVNRIQQRNLETRFIQDYYIRFRISPDRVANITKQITSKKQSILNKDFHPIAYFHNIYLWFSSFNKKLIGTASQFLHYSKHVIFAGFILIIAFFIFIKIISKKKQKFEKFIIYLTMMIIGATSISLEVLIINGFQAIYGYAYYQVGLIMTGYMIGLALGSFYALKSIPKLDSSFSRFKKYQFFAALYPILTLVFLSIMATVIVPEILVQLLFLLLIIGIGFIGGHQFPIANRLLFHEKSKIEITGGTVYGWDLFGSVIGAFTISTILIPLLGINYSCLLFSGLNLIALLILI